MQLKISDSVQLCLCYSVDRQTFFVRELENSGHPGIIFRPFPVNILFGLLSENGQIRPIIVERNVPGGRVQQKQTNNLYVINLIKPDFSIRHQIGSRESIHSHLTVTFEGNSSKLSTGQTGNSRDSRYSPG